MTKPKESDYTSYVSYTRALEECCDVLKAELDVSDQVKAERERILRIIYEASNAYGKTGECMWLHVRYKVEGMNELR